MTQSTPTEADLWNYVRTPTIDAIAKIKRYKQGVSEGLITTDNNMLKHGYKSLFDSPPSGERASFYNYNDLDGLQRLYQQVQSLPVVALKFLLPNDREEPLDFAKILLHEVAMIPILLADRYVAAHEDRVEVDETVLEYLYREQESYLLADDLRMDVYVPILGAQIAEESVFSKISIVRLSKAQQQSLADVPHVSPYDAGRLSAATHALKLENVPAFAGGCGLYFALEPYEPTFELVEEFFEAASIESSSSIGYAQMLLEPIEWFGDIDHTGNTRSVYLFRDYATRIDNLTRHAGELNLDQLAHVNLYFEKMSRSHPSIRVATRRLSAARTRDNDEDRIVDLCIGLEALLGGGSGSGEIVHKISLRAAAMLSRYGWGGSGGILSAIKDVYSYRSRVVHGVPGPHKKQLLHLDGMPIHASRLALAALSQILRIALTVDGFNPDKVDEMFVYSALDIAATHVTEKDCPNESN
ncbi:HEPN domain-containing protein [Microbispora sp. GKU 823]|uniref:HEPN domain-containing protein n=1 Tax=Microbispora sp. GKU 823 TaxID=1652100 RepID=UPI0011811248|nr:HEPN domain-containing protein [Microbispora sp. GKU 823]